MKYLSNQYNLPVNQKIKFTSKETASYSIWSELLVLFSFGRKTAKSLGQIILRVVWAKHF